MTSFRAVIYARKSIKDRTGDESGSITEQLRSGRHYAAAQGWDVVGEFVDDGVSAGNAPEDRKGWQELLAADGYERVIVRHIDRVSRRLIDFLNANTTLEGRGAGLVAIKQSIDMSSANGRLFANILASFAEYERELIRERVAGTRQDNIRSGRVVGGTVPYGWVSVPNPDGKGFVLRRDPDRIDWVRGMVERCQRGESVYKIKQWLDSEDAPLPSQNRKTGDWRYSTVEALLRHPVIAGATPYNPGNKSKERGDGLLLDERGLPVVDENVAILPLSQWRAMVASLDARNSAQSKPKALRTGTSGLFSGLIYCGDPRHDEPPRMWRGTIQGRQGYSCPECHHAISNFEEVLVEEFVHQKGDWPRWSKITEVYEGPTVEDLMAVEHRITELDDLIRRAPNREERGRLRAEQDDRYDERDRLREQPGRVVDRWSESDHYFSELWAMAEDIEDQRALLEDAMERVVVRRGKPGRRTRQQVLDRLDIQWKRPDEVGPRPLEV